MSLSFFLSNLIKHHFRIEKYKSPRFENMLDCNRLKRQVSNSLKHKEKPKLDHIFFFQSKSFFVYCFCIVIFEGLKYSNVKNLCKVSQMRKDSKQNILFCSCQLMRMDILFYRITFNNQKKLSLSSFISCIINKILKTF